jgi:hypothetical protein
MVGRQSAEIVRLLGGIGDIAALSIQRLREPVEQRPNQNRMEKDSADHPSRHPTNDHEDIGSHSPALAHASSVEGLTDGG